jgi:hypothetical protein
VQSRLSALSHNSSTIAIILFGLLTQLAKVLESFQGKKGLKWIQTQTFSVQPLQGWPSIAVI